MEKTGRGQPECAVEQYLSRGTQQQIRPAHDLSNGHGRVIHHAGQLVGGNVIVTPDHKIPEVMTGHKLLRAEVMVHEGNDFPIRHTEPPGETVGGNRGWR